MPFDPQYHSEEPSRADVDSAAGAMLLEFGASWCGHCSALSPAIESELRKRPEIQHLRIADGRGKPLGRSFRVKLWPTLVLLQDGDVIAQLVRPSPQDVQQALERLKVEE